MKIVCKFGGSSLATEEGISALIKIVRQDPARRFITASAPGRRVNTEKKVTDLLLDFFDGKRRNDQEIMQKRFAEIRERFLPFATFCGRQTLEEVLEQGEKELYSFNEREYIVSRGEAWTAILLSKILDLPLLSATEHILVDRNQSRAISFCKRSFQGVEKGVVPSFYGRGKNKPVALFPRGGGDITGSLIASAVGADVYENWTDVEGVYAVDPNRIQGGKRIEFLTRRELYTLSRLGMPTFHYRGIAPLGDVSLVIGSTFAPSGGRTWVRDTGCRDCPAGVIARDGKLFIVSDFQSETELISRLIKSLKDRGIKGKGKKREGYVEAVLPPKEEDRALRVAYQTFF